EYPCRAHCRRPALLKPLNNREHSFSRVSRLTKIVYYLSKNGRSAIEPVSRGEAKMKRWPGVKLCFALCALAVPILLWLGIALAADPPDEWKKITDAAKKEGKIVAGGPPTAVLRKQYKETFEKRFGIELELISAPGPQNAGKAMAEFKAGVRYFDVLHGGPGKMEPPKNGNKA